jgi:hypothetical protein
VDYFSETINKGLFRRASMEFRAINDKDAEKYVQKNLRASSHVVSLKAL